MGIRRIANKNYIPNWLMWFILELANYFDRTGDRETVDLLRPRVEGLLKFYAQYLNADGALENLPGWVFVEWSHANDTKLVKDGVNWPSNAFIGNLLRLIVLKSEGRDEQMAREIRGYYLKMAEQTGTLWEHDRPEASCNHAFASYLAILLDETNR